ncbi:hypothetical protein V8E36_008246 [Tilletia maclaganii]
MNASVLGRSGACDTTTTTTIIIHLQAQEQEQQQKQQPDRAEKKKMARYPPASQHQQQANTPPSRASPVSAARSHSTSASTLLHPPSGLTAMSSSGWGPPPSLQRISYTSAHNLPMSPSSSNALIMGSPSTAPSPSSSQHLAPPPLPPSRAMGSAGSYAQSHTLIYPPGANDDGEDDEEEDDEIGDDEEQYDDEDDDEDDDDEQDGGGGGAGGVYDPAAAAAAAVAGLSGDKGKKRKRKSGAPGDASNPSFSYSTVSASGHPSSSTATDPSTSHQAGAPSSSSAAVAAGAQPGTDTPDGGPPEKKPKVSRGSKACTNCRRLKMRCVPSTNEGGYPCKRCVNSGGSCVFEVSQRGKRTSKGKRTEAMAASLKKMEETLNSVLRSIRDPAGAAGGAVDLVPSSYSSAPESSGTLASGGSGGAADASPFAKFSAAIPRLTAAAAAAAAAVSGSTSSAAGGPRVSGAPAGSMAGASPGGQHINPASLISSASLGGPVVTSSALQQSQHQHGKSGRGRGYSSSRSSHGGSAAALSPEQIIHSDRAASGSGGPPRPVDSASTPSASSQYGGGGPTHRSGGGGTKTSPRLHSLPDNTLNPLGLLAEASLHNTDRLSRRAAAALHRRGTSFTSNSREPGGGSSSGGLAGGVGGAEDSEDGVSPGEGSSGMADGGGGGGGGGGGAEDGTRDAKGKGVAIAGHNGSLAGGKRAVLAASPGKAGSGGAGGAADGGGAAAGKAGEGGAGTGTGEHANDPARGTRFVPPEDDLSGHLGFASSTYFKPGPISNLPLRRIIIEREIPPQLLTQGILTSEEILELFRIFFHNCATHMLLLDPDMHTPALICARSPFLFTVVCCVASRYYSHKRPDLYAKCLAEARRLAFDIMSRGYKSVEIVQGFLLLSMWNQPSERYETDKTWLFSGVAMRMATDLNLHRKSLLPLPPDMSPNDPQVLEREREILNRERTWYHCFTMDRGLSATFGKPYAIREDFLIRNCKYWCEQRASRPWDLPLSALVELLRLTSRMLDMLYSSTRSVSGLNLELDYSTMLRIWNDQLEEFRDQWSYRGVFAAEFRPTADAFEEIKVRIAAQRAHTTAGDVTPPLGEESAGAGAGPGAGAGADGKSKAAAGTGSGGAGAAPSTSSPEESMRHAHRIIYFCVQQAPMRWHYSVLIINSFGLQRALDAKSDFDRGYFFSRCLSAAKGMLKAALGGLRPVLRYAPDAQFVMIAYACVFLLKLLRKEFMGWIDEEEVITLIINVIELLDEVAVNTTHTPALHATFLRRLLNARAETRPGSPYASAYHSRAQTPAPPPPPHPLGGGGMAVDAEDGPAGGGSAAGSKEANPAGGDLGSSAAAADHDMSSSGNAGGGGGGLGIIAGSGGGAGGLTSTLTAGEAAVSGLDALSGLAQSGPTSIFSNFAFHAPAGGSGGGAFMSNSATGPGMAPGVQPNQTRLAGYSPNLVSSPARFGGAGGGASGGAGAGAGGASDHDGHGSGAGGGAGLGGAAAHGSTHDVNSGLGLAASLGFSSEAFSGFSNFGNSSSSLGGLGLGPGGAGSGVGGMFMSGGNDAASAAVFGVSSLAPLFPSNVGFSGSGAPADSSHTAAMYLSHHPQQQHGGGGSSTAAGSHFAGGSSHGFGGGAPAQQHQQQQQQSQQQQQQQQQQHHQSFTASAAGVPASNGGGNGLGGANGNAAAYTNGFSESVFDDNFWSTLLPPGFVNSSSLNGTAWDFTMSGPGGGAGSNVFGGAGMGWGMSPAPGNGNGNGTGPGGAGTPALSHAHPSGTGASASKGGGGSNAIPSGGGIAGAGGGGGGANSASRRQSLAAGASGSTAAAGGKGSAASAAPASSSAPAAAPASASASASARGAENEGGNASRRPSTPSAVGAFNF